MDLAEYPTMISASCDAMNTALSTITFADPEAGSKSVQSEVPSCPWVGCSASAIWSNEQESKAHHDKHWKTMAEKMDWRHQM